MVGGCSQHQMQHQQCPSPHTRQSTLLNCTLRWPVRLPSAAMSATHSSVLSHGIFWKDHVCRPHKELNLSKSTIPCVIVMKAFHARLHTQKYVTLDWQPSCKATQTHGTLSLMRQTHGTLSQHQLNVPNSINTHWMVPLDPAQLAAVGGEARGVVKVTALRQLGHLPTAQVCGEALRDI